MRGTKATLIYRKTGNLRAVQLLLGRTKVGRTVRYLGFEGADASALAESIELLRKTTFIVSNFRRPVMSSLLKPMFMSAL